MNARQLPTVLMLVSDDSALVGDFDFDDSVFVQDDALAGEPGFEPWIDGPVNEVLFFFRNFFQKIIAFVDINVAGAACTDAAAVVVEMDVVLLCDFQNGQIRWYVVDGDWSNGFILEGEFDSCHNFKKSANVEFV